MPADNEVVVAGPGERDAEVNMVQFLMNESDRTVNEERPSVSPLTDNFVPGDHLIVAGQGVCGAQSPPNHGDKSIMVEESKEEMRNSDAKLLPAQDNDNLERDRREDTAKNDIMRVVRSLDYRDC